MFGWIYQPTLNRIALGVTILLFTGASTQVVGEVIKVPVGQQGQAQQVNKPPLGMTMEAVKVGFGKPATQSPARGVPPITRWEYNHFVVYFENDVVIHSVTKHKRRD